MGKSLTVNHVRLHLIVYLSFMVVDQRLRDVEAFIEAGHTVHFTISSHSSNRLKMTCIIGNEPDVTALPLRSMQQTLFSSISTQIHDSIIVDRGRKFSFGYAKARFWIALIATRDPYQSGSDPFDDSPPSDDDKHDHRDESDDFDSRNDGRNPGRANLAPKRRRLIVDGVIQESRRSHLDTRSGYQSASQAMAHAARRRPMASRSPHHRSEGLRLDSGVVGQGPSRA